MSVQRPLLLAPGLFWLAMTGHSIRAVRPRPGAEEMRNAYLDLLKLCLCDLAGTATTSVEGLPDGLVVSRELAGTELSLRAEGRDWPLHGLTMSGLRRLDDLQACVEAVVRDGVPGDLIEVGSWRGGGSILIRATLDSLGADDRTVWVADSFQGFPAAVQEPGREAAERYPATVEPYLAVFDFLAAPLEEVKASFARFGCDIGTEFAEGFFEETLPPLAQKDWAVIRLDGDTYDATMLALRCLYPGLAMGGQLIVDDYGALEECRAAVEDFRGAHGITEPLEQVDWTCIRWRREAGSPIERYRAPGAPAAPMNPAPRREHRHVATVRELELERQTAELRQRIAALEGELAAARDLERQLHEVIASTSWRLTRPLRELRRRRR